MEKDRKSRAVLYILRAALLMICFWKWGIDVRALVSGVFLTVLTYIAEQDIYTRRIPDRLLLGVGAVGIMSVPFFPEISLVSRGAGAIGVSLFLLAAALTAQGGFGGGDIKLMAASGWLLGYRAMIPAIFIGILTGGIYCIWMLARGKMTRKDRFAFGPFLAIGLAASCIYGEQILEWYLSVWQI